MLCRDGAASLLVERVLMSSGLDTPNGPNISRLTEYGHRSGVGRPKNTELDEAHGNSHVYETRSSSFIELECDGCNFLESKDDFLRRWDPSVGEFVSPKLQASQNLLDF